MMNIIIEGKLRVKIGGFYFRCFEFEDMIILGVVAYLNMVFGGAVGFRIEVDVNCELFLRFTLIAVVLS